MAPAVVGRLEFAPVDGHQFRAEEIQPAAQQVEVLEQRLERRAVVPAEIRDGLEIRAHPAQQPDHFEIARRLGLQTPARTHAVQIAVEIELEQIRRVIRRPPRLLGLRAGETQRRKVEPLGVSVDEARRGVVTDVVLHAGREELDLGSIRAAQAAHGGASKILARASAFKIMCGKVFTQSVPSSATGVTPTASSCSRCTRTRGR